MIKRILIPVDFSENSLSPLNYAADLAKRYEAELLVLHVVEPVYYQTSYVGEVPVLSAEWRDAQLRYARSELAKVAERLRQQGVTCTTLLEEGPAYLQIVNLARAKNVDMIVMATHGRTGVSRLLIGSVAEKVVRTSECPVLTVRGQQTEKGAAPAS